MISCNDVINVVILLLILGEQNRNISLTINTELIILQYCLNYCKYMQYCIVYFKKYCSYFVILQIVYSNKAIYIKYAIFADQKPNCAASHQDGWGASW